MIFYKKKLFRILEIYRFAVSQSAFTNIVIKLNRKKCLIQLFNIAIDKYIGIFLFCIYN